MDLFSWSSCFSFILSLAFQLLIPGGVSGAKFTFVNRCDYTIWPGILANAGSPRLDSTGFELVTDSSFAFQAPTGWSGRFWGRTGCNFDISGQGFCVTGDCGSGQVECNGAGAEPPVTLAEFTLGSGGQDFYDVSLVDGYNLPMLVEVNGGSGLCASTGCLVDLNRVCPAELKVGDGEACKSACDAFRSPEYCCSGAYGSPATCKPTVYSEMFKSACPRSYSYAYDDTTSTFTCSGADYTITFCPSSPSQKSTTPVTPVTTTPPEDSNGLGSESGSGSMNFDSGPGTETASGTVSESVTGSQSGSQSQAMLADGSWLAALAMGDSAKTVTPSALQSALILSTSFYLILSSIYLR
ncbi:Thaumatin-like protein 1 [Ancistrocladus abbreviatus]